MKIKDPTKLDIMLTITSNGNHSSKITAPKFHKKIYLKPLRSSLQAIQTIKFNYWSFQMGENTNHVIFSKNGQPINPTTQLIDLKVKDNIISTKYLCLPETIEVNITFHFKKNHYFRYMRWRKFKR